MRQLITQAPSPWRDIQLLVLQPGESREATDGGTFWIGPNWICREDDEAQQSVCEYTD